MNNTPANNDNLPAMPTKLATKLPTKPTESGHILVMTSEQIDQLGDILDNPFMLLNDLQKALFMRGFRLIRV